MDDIFSTVRLTLAAVFLIVVHLNTDVTEAMEVTSSGPQTIQRPQGTKVILRCTYTPGPSDLGELDIEWYSVSPDTTQKDKLILSFTGGKVLHYGDTSLAKRMTFTGDPKTGDATVAISDAVVSDTGTYQCKVKKAPGVDMRKITLVVMVRPSVPKCWVEGGEEKGGDVSLRCKSSRGSIPLTYTWTRESGGPIPPTATQDPQTGELLLKNHTDANVGNYVCVAKNPVGQEQCKYTLHAYNPTNKAGVIVGAVIGALLLLLLLLLLIWLLVCCCLKRRYQKEVANEIREDVPAPESRPTSRASSLRSVLAYRSHPGVHYHLQKGQPSRAESARSAVYSDRSNGTAKPASHGQSPPPLKYDSKYGYPV
ncbi:Coxsackievirus and adenovirus receptor [Merluccius polli]|uniref:Coxsackievirus and adenovirus receptor n=1 Tax=Merluccius polli TaxID=89951 RepID=A0AA47NV36_MERPO|nr:Coxsackievirus and adenovirus receptor [Merluccius polli]